MRGQRSETHLPHNPIKRWRDIAQHSPVKFGHTHGESMRCASVTGFEAESCVLPSWTNGIQSSEEHFGNRELAVQRRDPAKLLVSVLVSRSGGPHSNLPEAEFA